jgi:aspartate/tyrosine/aromatic aminotransferase
MQERKLEVRDRGRRKAGLKEAKKGINMYADKRSVMYQRRSVKKNEKEMKENEVERKERNGKEGRKEYRKKERNCYHWIGFEAWSFKTTRKRPL